MSLLFLYATFNLLTSIAEFVIGGFALFSPNRTPRRTVLALWMASLGIWSFGVSMHAISNDYAWSLLWSRALHFGAVFIPVIYLHLVMVLTKRYSSFVLKLLYGMSFVFLVFIPTPLMIAEMSPIGPFKYFPKAGILYHFYVVQFIVCVMIALFLLWKELRTSVGHEQKQIKFIFFGSLIAYSTGPTAFLYEYNIPVFPFGTPLVLLNSLVIAYAILKHRLMDITVIIRKTLIYAAIMAILTCIYLVVVTLFAHLFEGLTGFRAVFPSSIAAVLITLLFQPLRKRVQAFVDSKFFRQYVDREEKLYELSREVITHTTPEAMSDALIHVIAETLHPKNGVIYLRASQGGGFSKMSGIESSPLPQQLDEDNPLSAFFRENPQPFILDDLKAHGRSYSTRSKETREDVA
jgi:hypothetical protein